MNICIFHDRLGYVIQDYLKKELIKENIFVVQNTDKFPPGYKEIDILIANNFPKGLVEKRGNLKWIQLTSSGTEQLIGEKLDGIQVTHAASVSSKPVSEFVIMSILALAKDFPRLIIQQHQKQWKLPDSRMVKNSRLVIVGMGYIGKEVARLAKSLGVHVTGVTKEEKPSLDHLDLQFSINQLKEVVKEAEYLVISVTGNQQNRFLIDHSIITALPDYANIINVSRIHIVDMESLVSALKKGKLRSALTDVSEIEPLPTTHPLWDIPGLSVTPHGAFMNPHEGVELAELFLENYFLFQQNNPLKHVVETLLHKNESF